MIKLKIGDIVAGEVTETTNFGAFVKINKTGDKGLIHISEIANAFVKDVNDYLVSGDRIRVKIKNIKSDGKIELSWKDVPEDEKWVKEFIPADTREILSKFNIDNFYLVANRYLDEFKSKTEFDRGRIFKKLERLAQKILDNNETIRKFIERNNNLAESLEESGYLKKSFELTNDYRLVFGLGGANVLETNMFLHHIYGIPYIPGSALKGVAKAWAVEILRKKLGVENYEEIESLLESDKLDPKDINDRYLQEINTYRVIFGTQQKVGKVNFLDAYPCGKINLKIDIMTPHFKEYYKEMEKEENLNNWPTDYDEPNPIPFLVLEGVSFKFILYGEDSYYLNTASTLLKSGLKNLGIGAKTMVGYGYFE